MIGINNLSLDFSSIPLFKDISFTINENDKLALVGKNGAGKSTLLKIISGQISPSSGSISVPNEIKIGYLPQEMKTEDDTSLFEETKKAFKERIDLENKLEHLIQELTNRNDYNSEEYEKLIIESDELRSFLSLRFPNNMDAEIEKTLIGLGFKNTDFNRPTSEFSGGWRMRVELAKILLQKPDLLLLDEPTNHLDINSIQWLEQFLINYSGAVVLVSHDRAFLDNVTKRTIEITCGVIYDYKVPYTSFTNLRRERIDQQLKAYENQQKLIADTKDFIERFRYKATKAVQVQSRIKQLEKIIPIEIDLEDNSSVNFKFPLAERSGDFPLIVENLSKSYGDLEVFSGVDITIKRGEKIAFVGSNGEGKSTFVKCIMNEIPYDGFLKIGHNIKLAYFAQNQAQKLNEKKTVFETVDEVATGEIRTRLKDLLATFLFRGEDIDKKVSVLSGGEKTRLAMAKMLLEPANFLILDEPTNHLDMRTKDVLKKAIKDFNGTVIIVSHDRNFLDGLVDKVYEFSNKRMREFIGGIYDYLQFKKNQSNINTISETPDNNQKINVNKGNLSYQQKKELEKNIRKAEKNIADIEAEIENLENALSLIEKKLSEGEISDELMKEYSKIKNQIEDQTELWEEAQLKLDKIKEND
ncbi:MAG: ABC-F family ATP-binding cassette domain-containing protein [Muribaculaceae bacterium]|nr:ABC-F family ATP-binding cassette domain-containing protein [Muribaculaceae bacterium]